MKVVYLYSGEDGQSHFADCEVATVQSVLGVTSIPLPALEVSLRDTAGGPTSVDFRPAPRRQLVILLRGQVEYFCGDGSRRLLGSGDILVADDTRGQGHRVELSRARGCRSSCLWHPKPISAPGSLVQRNERSPTGKDRVRQLLQRPPGAGGGENCG